MIVGKKNKMLKRVFVLSCIVSILCSQNAMAFSLIDPHMGVSIESNYLSPQLNILNEVFIHSYGKVVKADRWLNPDIVGCFGGTGGNIAGNVLSSSDLNEFLSKELFVSFIISPHDDGGSSVKLQNMLDEVLGYTLSAGDTNNIFSGLTDYFKKRILRTRFGDGLSGVLLHNKLQEIINDIELLARPKHLFKDELGTIPIEKISIAGIEHTVSFDAKRKVFRFNEGQEIAIGQKVILGDEEFIISESSERMMLYFMPDDNKSEPHDYDLETDFKWSKFTKKILNLSSVIDDNFIAPKTKTFLGKSLDISKGSMGNFLIAAKMIECGAYDPAKKGQIDQGKYHQGIKELCDLLGINNGFVSFSTFDQATLYVKLKSIAIEENGNALLLDQSENNEHGLIDSGITVDQIDNSKGIIDFKYNDVSLQIKEYIEGYVYRNNLGNRDSYSELIMSLDDFKKNSVISHDNIDLEINIIDDEIKELVYRYRVTEKIAGKEEIVEKELKIAKDQLFEYKLGEYIIFGLPENLNSISESQRCSLPRFYIDKDKAQLHIVLDTKGLGVDIYPNGKKIKVKGRLVIEQTNLTEGLHYCGIVDFGFVNGVKPQVNKESLLAIKNASLLIMGPGSQYTSLMSLLLIPEVVEALRQRVKLGKESLFIFNAVRDNETVDSDTISQVIRDIERITESRFGDIFNHAVINDMKFFNEEYEKARWTLNVINKDQESQAYSDAKKVLDEYETMKDLMNEMDNKKSSSSRSASSFSESAKYSRGSINFDKEALFKLIDQRVEVHKTKVKLSSREVRKSGKAETEASVRYDNVHIANIIDEILWERWAVFNNDLELARLVATMIEEHFAGDMDEFDKAIERIKNEGKLKSTSPAEAVRHLYERLKQEDSGLSLDKCRLLQDKEVIITNLKHTLCIENGITPKIKQEIKLFLQRGGKLVVVSGFELPEMKKRLLEFVDQSLWSSIILVENYGTDAWYWDRYQLKHKRLFTSFYEEANISQDQKNLWEEIVKDVRLEYSLDRQLKDIGRYSDKTIAIVEDRKTMIALRLGSRRYLPSLNMVAKENLRLEQKSIPLIGEDRILRTPITERLNVLFVKYGLPVRAVLGGTGTINTMVRKAVDKGETIQRVLWAAQDKKLLPKVNLEQKMLIMGKGNYEIAKKFESDQVPWVVFQVARHQVENMIEFKRNYGVQAAESFLEELNLIQSSLNPVDLTIKSSDFQSVYLEGIGQAI